MISKAEGELDTVYARMLKSTNPSRIVHRAWGVAVLVVVITDKNKQNIRILVLSIMNRCIQTFDQWLAV